VKIKGTCKNCDREFLVEQVLESGGRCPWCGESFQKDYAAVLVDGLQAAQDAGATLENALEKISELHPRFTLDARSVLDGLKASL
jgi:PHP family Zn ribbon phosphoesterase